MPTDDDIPDYLRGVQQDVSEDPFESKSRFAPPTPVGAPKATLPPPPEPGVHPVTLMFGGVFVVGGSIILVGAVLAAWASVVTGHESATRASGQELVEVVVEQERIMAELGARGADRSALQKRFDAVGSTAGHAQHRAAWEYTRAVQSQLVALGDLRSATVRDRTHKIGQAQNGFEANLASWQSSSGNPIGQFAIALGLADAPPDVLAPRE